MSLFDSPPPPPPSFLTTIKHFNPSKQNRSNLFISTCTASANIWSGLILYSLKGLETKLHLTSVMSDLQRYLKKALFDQE